MNPGKQFSKMFSVQLKLTFREKQVWFWGIFFPVILMVMFMLIFTGRSDSDFKAKIAIVDPHPNAASQMLLQQIRQLPVFEIKSGKPVSREQADTWIKDKDVDALIVLPESEEATSVLLVVNKENERGATAQAISGILDKFIQQANLAAVGATPTYELRIKSISAGSDSLKYEDFLLTGMIALTVAQGGLFGMTGMVEMRRKGLLKRLRMTPANMGLFGLSDILVRILFGVLQIVMLALIGVYGFGATLHINVIALVVVFLAGALSFTAIGYFISSMSKTMEAYMGMANIASFLMMFLSGVFFPVETMPAWLQPVSHVLPLTYFVDGLRSSMVYATGISSSTVWSDIGVLVLWGMIAFGLASLLYKTKSITATR